MRKLYKSTENKILAGVIGGMGEYLEIDPTVLRLAYIIIAVATGVLPAVVGYIVAILIVPQKPTTVHMHHTEKHEHEHNHKHEETVKKDSGEPAETPKSE